MHSPLHRKLNRKLMQSSSDFQLLSRELRSASSVHSLNYVGDHLCFISIILTSINKMYPKVIASLLYATLACKSFHRNTALLDSRGNLYIYIYSQFLYAQFFSVTTAKNLPCSLSSTKFFYCRKALSVHFLLPCPVAHCLAL